MRRILLALAAGAALLTPTAASANHQCAEGFEILCTRVCIAKPSICTH